MQVEFDSMHWCTKFGGCGLWCWRFCSFSFSFKFLFWIMGSKIKSAPKIHATVEFDEVCMCTKFVGTASLDYL